MLKYWWGKSNHYYYMPHFNLLQVYNQLFCFKSLKVHIHMYIQWLMKFNVMLQSYHRVVLVYHRSALQRVYKIVLNNFIRKFVLLKWTISKILKTALNNWIGFYLRKWQIFSFLEFKSVLKNLQCCERQINFSSKKVLTSFKVATLVKFMM